MTTALMGGGAGGGTPPGGPEEEEAGDTSGQEDAGAAGNGAPQGDFLGGMILPGLDMMARALAAGTAQLPHIDARASGLAPFADNTADAIASGCIAAQAGAIERAATALTRKCAEAEMTRMRSPAVRCCARQRVASV